MGQTHLFSLKTIEEERLLSDSDVHLKIRGVADPDEEKLNKLKLKNANIIIGNSPPFYANCVRDSLLLEDYPNI